MNVLSDIEGMELPMPVPALRQTSFVRHWRRESRTRYSSGSMPPTSKHVKGKNPKAKKPKGQETIQKGCQWDLHTFKQTQMMIVYKCLLISSWFWTWSIARPRTGSTKENECAKWHWRHEATHASPCSKANFIHKALQKRVKDKALVQVKASYKLSCDGEESKDQVTILKSCRYIQTFRQTQIMII